MSYEVTLRPVSKTVWIRKKKTISYHIISKVFAIDFKRSMSDLFHLCARLVFVFTRFFRAKNSATSNFLSWFPRCALRQSHIEVVMQTSKGKGRTRGARSGGYGGCGIWPRICPTSLNVCDGSTFSWFKRNLQVSRDRKSSFYYISWIFFNIGNTKL